ncbi:MAG: hypothetical protein HQ537_02240 [Parcubacteria group bacterium]|nr:hypothetical protein [Parcubacteria group bacterium]
MKRMILLSAVMLFLASGCAIVPTRHIGANNPINWQAGPGQEAYKYILVQNQSPYYIKICPGQGNVLLSPGTEIIIKRTRPLGWASPSFGEFRFMAYAYREYDPRTGQLDWFVGQREARVNLDGQVRTYNGRVFADRIEFGPSGWRLPPWGHPDKWTGSFLGIVPWEMRFKHK